MLLQYRTALAEDIDLYFNWTNDEATRRNSYQSKPIDYQGHTEWFLRKIKSSDILMLVFENEKGEVVGQVRIEKSNTENIIGISIDAQQRGKSYASEMIKLASQQFFNQYPLEKQIIAYIKLSNEASRKSFEKANYQLMEKCQVAGAESWKMVCSI
jgi:RimJ/RimL family protein N-acetyltransferase